MLNLPYKKPLIALAGFLLLALSSYSLAGNLTANVDRSNISMEETLQLTVRYDEQVGYGGPNFDLLNENFEVLSNNRSNQFRSINGKAESFTQWKLMLAPKKTGKLLVPSFSLDGNFSEAIEISVIDKGQVPSGQLRDLFLEAEISKTQSRVQEEIIYTVRLYTSVNLRSINSEELALEDAFTLQLAEHRYQRRIQGRAFGVVEVIYAIYPQNSGELVIPRLTYDVNLSGRSRDPWSDPFGNQGGSLKRLRTEEQRLHIKPKPKTYTGEHWLPAQDLQLEQDWSSDPNAFKVGEPITRVITLTGKGLTAAQLPPLKNLVLDGVKTYPDQPQTQDQQADTGVTGIRTETMAIVPTKSGKMTLPAITVTWWDTENNQQRKANLPATTINVATTTAPLMPKFQNVDPQMSSPTAINPSNIDPTNRVSANQQPVATAWLWVSSTAVFALLSLYLALQNLRLRRNPTSTRQQSLSDHNNSEKLAFKQLKRSCQTADLAAIRQSYLQWAKAFWTTENTRSIQATQPLIDEPQLKSCLQALDSAIYSDHQDITWNGSHLISLIEKLRQTQHQATEKMVLQPLYPQ